MHGHTKFARYPIIAFAVLLLAERSTPVHAAPVTVVDTAVNVIEALMAKPTEGIPARLVDDAYGVAIIPDVVKGGLVVGVRRGHGVLLLRDSNGRWQRPYFVTLTGASVGWQAGLQATDLVLVFKNRRSVENLLRGKMTLGVDASAAAGPVGRTASAATDGKLAAEIYSYSRSRGLFAGVSLDGAKIEIDRRAYAAYYANMPQNAAPPSVIRLIERLDQYAADKPPLTAPPAPPVSLAPPARRPEVILNDLVGAHQRLQTLLDDRWRQFLAIPLPNANNPNQKMPTLEQWQAAKTRFDQVARDARYTTLAQRAEFVAVQRLLQEYLAATAPRTSRLALPPPPTMGR